MHSLVRHPLAFLGRFYFFGFFQVFSQLHIPKTACSSSINPFCQLINLLSYGIWGSIGSSGSGSASSFPLYLSIIFSWIHHAYSISSNPVGVLSLSTYCSFWPPLKGLGHWSVNKASLWHWFTWRPTLVDLNSCIFYLQFILSHLSQTPSNFLLVISLKINFLTWRRNSSPNSLNISLPWLSLVRVGAYGMQ